MLISHFLMSNYIFTELFNSFYANKSENEKYKLTVSIATHCKIPVRYCHFICKGMQCFNGSSIIPNKNTERDQFIMIATEHFTKNAWDAFMKHLKNIRKKEYFRLFLNIIITLTDYRRPYFENKNLAANGRRPYFVDQRCVDIINLLANKRIYSAKFIQCAIFGNFKKVLVKIEKSILNGEFLDLPTFQQSMSLKQLKVLNLLQRTSFEIQNKIKTLVFQTLEGIRINVPLVLVSIILFYLYTPCIINKF